MILETRRMKLHSPSIVYTKLVQQFYWKNRNYLKPWEPTRTEGFYSFEYQFQDLLEQSRAFRKGEEYRFWLTPKDKPNIIIGSVVISGIFRGNFQSCFMGYKMDKDWTGQGRMTEACRRMVEFAFSRKGADLHRIEINIVPENTPSVRIAKKLGFTQEGFSRKYLQIDGQWKDHLRFAKTREESIYDFK